MCLFFVCFFLGGLQLSYKHGSECIHLIVSLNFFIYFFFNWQVLNESWESEQANQRAPHTRPWVVLLLCDFECSHLLLVWPVCVYVWEGGGAVLRPLPTNSARPYVYISWLFVFSIFDHVDIFAFSRSTSWHAALVQCADHLSPPSEFSGKSESKK